MRLNYRFIKEEFKIILLYSLTPYNYLCVIIIIIEIENVKFKFAVFNIRVNVSINFNKNIHKNSDYKYIMSYKSTLKKSSKMVIQIGRYPFKLELLQIKKYVRVIFGCSTSL